MSARKTLVQGGRLYRMLVYVGLLLLMLAVVRAIDYDSFRNDKEPRIIMRKNNRPLRRILENEFSDPYGRRKTYSTQEATELMLHFSTLLRFEILDIFGSLIFEHYEDFNLNQVEALFKVYDETMHRKYNIFDILPSVLKYKDLRPSSICRYIRMHVKTCLKETVRNCMALRKHDSVKPRQQFIVALNYTHNVYHDGRMHQLYPNPYFLDMAVRHLQQGVLTLNDRLVAGFLNNIQYDDYDERVRQAEKQTVRHLLVSKHGQKKESTRRSLSVFQISRFYTVAPLVRYYLQVNWHTFPDPVAHQAHFLAGHVIKHVGSINPNIELLGTVYEGSVLHLKYLFDLIIPSDTVDPDVSSAKDYLMRKVTALNIVDKFLRIEKYQQSSPEQLFMETMYQLKEIGFARDIATALHVQAQFWHRSVVVENLNDLLLLFNSYENLRTVPDHRRFILVIDRIREYLWNAKNVTIDIICNNPRACLRLGLEIVLKCDLVSIEIKNWIMMYFSFVNERGSLIAIVCNRPRETIPSTVATPIATTRPRTIMETMATVKLPKVTIAPTTISIESEETIPVITLAPTTTTVPTEPPTVATTVTTEIPTTTTTTTVTTEATTTTTTTPKPVVTTKLTTTEQPIIVTTTTQPTTVTTTTPEATTYEQPTTVVHKTLKTIPPTIVVPTIVVPTITVPTTTEEPTTESDEAIYSFNCTTEETEPTTLTTVTTAAPTIPSVIFVSKTESIPVETTTVTERTTETTQTWSQPKLEEIITTQQFIPKIVTPFSTEVTRSCEGEGGCTSESVAVVTETTEPPKIIRTTSEISVELNLHHNKTVTTVVSSEVSCEGSENCDGGCSGENCSGNCTGPNCSTECSGDDCPCEDCGVEEPQGCVGPLCNPPEVECSGENCEPSSSSEDCGEGKNCQNESGACSGEDCSASQSIECTGDDCRNPPTSDQTNSNTSDFGKTDVVVVCHNRDPHHQRKKERMKKMQEKIVAEKSPEPPQPSASINTTDNTDNDQLTVVHVPPPIYFQPNIDPWRSTVIHQERPLYPTYTPVKYASAYYANLNKNTNKNKNVNSNVNQNWNYVQAKSDEDQATAEIRAKKKTPGRVPRDFDIYTDI